jgi:Uma2 family endonuclease
MLGPQPEGRLSYAEFRKFVDSQDGRYEFVDGRAVAMGIPSDEHQRLAKILIRKLDEHLGAGPCEALPSIALWTVERERAPDILVRCINDEKAWEARLVVEILSANRGDDLVDKVTEYQAVETIKQYLVIDSTRHWVRCDTRNADGFFVAPTDHVGGLLEIASIEYILDIDGLYRESGI